MDNTDAAFMALFVDEDEAVAPTTSQPLVAIAPLPPVSPSVPPVTRSSNSAPAKAVSSDATESLAVRSVVFGAHGKKAEVAEHLQKHKQTRRGLRVPELDAEGAPTKAKTAYVLYQESLAKEGYRGSLKQVAYKWRHLSDDERRVFDEKATSQKIRYQEELKKYFGDKGQDMMSILVQCSTDNMPRKRRRKNDEEEVVEAEPKDALEDFLDENADCGSLLTGDRSQPAEIAAPQLRLDANGDIIVDAASLQVGVASNSMGAGLASSYVAQPYEHAYKRTKRSEWTAEENERFWMGVSVYGTDLLLIQTLFRDKTGHQIKSKFKAEEKRNRVKMDDHIYGVHRKKFTKELFEEHFGRIDSSKHFVPPVDDKVDVATAVEGPSPKAASQAPATVAAPAVPVEPPVDKNAGLDSLLDLFD